MPGLTWSSWNESSRGQQRGWKISCARKWWGSWACSASRTDNWKGTSSTPINIWRDSAKRREPGSSWWCQWYQGLGQKAMYRNCCSGISTWTWRRISLLCRWLRTGASCSERLWTLPHWRYSRSIWKQSHAMCSGMTLLEQRGCTTWPAVVLSNLTHSGILWALKSCWSYHLKK